MRKKGTNEDFHPLSHRLTGIVIIVYRPRVFNVAEAGSVLRRAALFLAPRPFGGGLNDTLLARLRQAQYFRLPDFTTDFFPHIFSSHIFEYTVFDII